jgi:hypothetical protein
MLEKESDRPPEEQQEWVKGWAKNMSKDIATDWDEITVILDESEKVNGMWQLLGRQIRLKFYSHKTGAEYANTVRHELRHMVQSLINYAKRVSGAGLPSKRIRTPDFKQQLEPKELSKVKQRLRGVGVDPVGIEFHHLDDVEFYTDLADAIEGFKQTRAKFEDELAGIPINDLIRYAVGLKPQDSTNLPIMRRYMGSPLSFFRTLKRVPAAKGKYQKGVKELIKAVT